MAMDFKYKRKGMKGTVWNKKKGVERGESEVCQKITDNEAELKDKKTVVAQVGLEVGQKTADDEVEWKNKQKCIKQGKSEVGQVLEAPGK
ncbi:hypothetical protein BDD12DRAFT_883573 [Trichophaea hybrida]|nr:hypothetical protein BDD12DRAFT_883573 [Trichophaea hybrida]